MEWVLPQIRRILGFCNFNENEDTYGCCDRAYWHYKLIDFPNSWFQEVGLLLSILYKYNLDPLFYKKESVKRHIEAVIVFWIKWRNKDGSCIEVYPNERSFCSTAFSTYSILYSLYFIEDKELAYKYLPLLKKTLIWLKANDSFEVPNQLSGAIGALILYAQLTGNDEWKDAAYQKFEKLKTLQNKEGVFVEYGGPDAGYTTISISALVTLHMFTKDQAVLNVIDKGVCFIGNITDEYGRYDHSGFSRQTQFIYPRAFAYRNSVVFQKLKRGIKENKVIYPAWMDDRYCLPLTIDYLLAATGDKYVNDNK